LLDCERGPPRGAAELSERILLLATAIPLVTAILRLHRSVAGTLAKLRQELDREKRFFPCDAPSMASL
jgi:hypothetical protein